MASFQHINVVLIIVFGKFSLSLNLLSCIFFVCVFFLSKKLHRIWIRNFLLSTFICVCDYAWLTRIAPGLDLAPTKELPISTRYLTHHEKYLTDIWHIMLFEKYMKNILHTMKNIWHIMKNIWKIYERYSKYHNKYLKNILKDFYASWTIPDLAPWCYKWT